MDSKIKDFLEKQRVGVLSVVLSDGASHSATVHYSHQTNPIKIFIQTTNTTLKAQPFLKGEVGKGSFVTGFSEEEWLTLQMHGTVKKISDEKELEDVYKIHYAKHPDAEQYKGPKTVFLEFIPTWSRYTDFNTEPETIIENKL